MNLLKKFMDPVDMTYGAPWKKIILFTVPMIVGNVVQQLYNTVDSVVVGKYIGDNALAAVGSAFPILNLLIVLFVGISAGAGIMVAQYFGAKDREKLSVTIGNCIVLTAIASIFIMVAATMATRPLLRLLNTPDSIIDWCTSYLQILFLGAAGLAYFNILGGILRGLGDSIAALVYLLIASIINVVLDLFFVIKLNMGVAGVALATAIAQGISAILCAVKLIRMREHFALKSKHLKLHRIYSYNIIRLGLPSGVTQMIMAMAMILVQSLTNGFGEMFIAANVIVMRVDGFVMMPNFSFGMAMTTYAGQNVGARSYDRVVRGAREGTLMAVGITTVMTILILIFGRPLMGIFTTTSELVAYSIRMMRILAIGYIAMAVMQCLTGVMRGAGDAMTPMWISMISTVGIRVPLAYLLVYLTRSAEHPKGRPECLFFSLVTSWVISTFITWILYRRGKWRTRAI